MFRPRLYSILLLIIVVICVPVGMVAQERPDSDEASPGLSYGVVVDNSGSYRKILETVIKAVTEIVSGHKAEDEAFFLTFVDTEKIVVRQEMTSRQEDLVDAAENMFIEGGPTAILDAVWVSARYLVKNAKKDNARKKLLILVTDGDERESATKIGDLVKYLKENDIRVFILGLSDEKIYTKVIDKLAKETNGAKFIPRSINDVSGSVNDLKASIRKD